MKLSPKRAAIHWNEKHYQTYPKKKRLGTQNQVTRQNKFSWHTVLYMCANLRRLEANFRNSMVHENCGSTYDATCVTERSVFPARWQKKTRKIPTSPVRNWYDLRAGTATESAWWLWPAITPFSNATSQRYVHSARSELQTKRRSHFSSFCFS